jgi:Sec-independent protein secretion pathway component TatC
VSSIGINKILIATGPSLLVEKGGTPEMIDFLIGSAFVAMIVLPAAVAFFQSNKSEHRDINS